jgi:hypothetical protein
VPSPAEELREPIVIEIEDDFSRLPEAEQKRLTAEWPSAIDGDEAVDLGVSSVELLAEAREESGWT